MTYKKGDTVWVRGIVDLVEPYEGAEAKISFAGRDAPASVYVLPSDIAPQPAPDALTVRDQFAMRAMAALGSAFSRDWHNPNSYQIGVMVSGSYAVADAMMRERAK